MKSCNRRSCNSMKTAKTNMCFRMAGSWGRAFVSLKRDEGGAYGGWMSLTWQTSHPQVPFPRDALIKGTISYTCHFGAHQ